MALENVNETKQFPYIAVATSLFGGKDARMYGNKTGTLEMFE